MSKEIWKWIPGYRGLYKISDQGRVKSVARKGRLNSRIIGSTKNKYIMVQLRKNGRTKRFYVHQIVLTVFRGPRPEGMEARHLDDNKHHNHLDNLEWGTNLDNHIDRLKNKRDKNLVLSESKVILIRKRLEKSKLGDQKKLANELGISEALVSLVARRRTWRHV